MCFFVKSKFNISFVYVWVYLSACLASGKSSPSNDFCKKLGTFLGPRLSQIAREIRDFVGKSKTIRYSRMTPSYHHLIYGHWSQDLDTSINWTPLSPHITASETTTLSVHQCPGSHLMCCVLSLLQFRAAIQVCVFQRDEPGCQIVPQQSTNNVSSTTHYSRGHEAYHRSQCRV